MALTYCDAEVALKDGSYKQLTDAELQEMRAACLNVSGPNMSAVQRVQKVGEIIQQELDWREARKQLHASTPTISNMQGDSSETQPPPTSALA